MSSRGKPPGAAQRSGAAPAWHVAQWFNAPAALSLGALRGRVIVLHAFQMLCPGCVMHGLPQAQRVHETFDPADVAVVGLHTVFEHHAAMTPTSLAAFIHEYRLTFPIGVDEPDGGDGLPRTMRAYAMRGTPTLVLIDRDGRIRLHAFGPVDDMRLGADIATLLRTDAATDAPLATTGLVGCTAEGCDA